MPSAFLRLCFLMLSVAFGQQEAYAQKFILNKHTPFVGIYDFYYYIDSTNMLSAEQVCQLPLSAYILIKNQQPNLNAVPHPVWMRFEIRKEDPRPYFLYVKNSSAYKDVELCAFVNNQMLWQKKNGQNVSHKARIYLYTDRIFDLEQTPHVTYLLKISTAYALQLRVDIYRDTALIKRNHYFDLLQGCYYGIALVILLYNLALFLSTRESIYLYYSATVLGAATITSLLFGHFFEFVLPQYSAFLTHYIVAIIGVASVPLILFIYRFINVRKYLPKTNKLQYAFIAAYLSCTLLNLCDAPDYLLRPIVQLTAILLLLSSLFLGIYISTKGYRPALYFVAAWTAYIAGTVIFVLQDANVLESNYFTFYATEAGSAIEMVLLAFGIADKIRIYKREKFIAERQAYTALQEQKEFDEKQNEQLELKVLDRTKEMQETATQLAQIAQEIEVKRTQLDAKNRQLTQGIRSAQIIQEAILPSSDLLKQYLQHHFCLFMPKDIVSGDFYWLKAKEDKTYLAVADCTGHGVHGAFIALIGSKLLDDALGETNDLAKILETLHHSLVNQFKQRETNNNDGMDIALCCLDKTNAILTFAGAKSSIFIARDGRIEEVKSATRHIGGVRRFAKGSRPFISQELKLKNKDWVYMATDGYFHQYDLRRKAKLGKPRFKEILLQNHLFLPPVQASALKLELDSWAAGTPQIDDILVLGFQYEA